MVITAAAKTFIRRGAGSARAVRGGTAERK